MAKSKKHKNAIDKNHKYNMDLLAVEGFDDVPSALAALHSVKVDLRAVEKDYDALIQKTFELELKLEEAHRVIVSQAIQIHTLTENRNAEARD